MNLVVLHRRQRRYVVTEYCSIVLSLFLSLFLSSFLAVTGGGSPSYILNSGGGKRRGHAPRAELCRQRHLEEPKYGIMKLAASGELAFALQTVIFLVFTLLTRP